MALTPIQKLKKAGEEQHKAFLKTAEGQKLAKQEQQRIDRLATNAARRKQAAVNQLRGEARELATGGKNFRDNDLGVSEENKKFRVRNKIAQMQQQAEASAAAQRPPTPPPTFIGDLNQPTTEEDPSTTAQRKMMRQTFGFGEDFSDAEIDSLLSGVTDFSSVIEATKGGQQEAIDEMERQRIEAQGQLETERERLDKVRQRRIKSLEEERQAFTEAALGTARREAQETTSIEERLLGGRGNLTTTVGATRLGGIQAKLSERENIARSTAQANFELERAVLEGADQATIAQMEGNIAKLMQAENVARLDAIADLTDAKIAAQEAGDQARLSLINAALDKESVEKLAAEVDVNVTRQVNDGFLYDATGNKIVDAEGNQVKFTSPEELDALVKGIRVGDRIVNPVTGEVIFESPELGEGGSEFEDGETQGSSFLNESADIATTTVDGLIEILDRSPGIAGRSADVPLFDFMRSDDFRNFEGQLDTLKANIAFGVLTAMREASKTGGALGQVSDKELIFLQSKLGSLKMGQTPAQLRAQLVQIKESVQRWKTAAVEEAGGSVTASIQRDPNVEAAFEVLGREPTKSELEEILQQSISPEVFSDMMGLAPSQGVSVSTSGMRTDRHNNPTAFTTDVARTAGLVEGVDYVVGDAFPNNPNLKTARLLGDPIATTIKAIDNMGFYTQGGQPRWNHTAISDSKWNSMSYAEKKNVIKGMYQKEGGKDLMSKFA